MMERSFKRLIKKIIPSSFIRKYRERRYDESQVIYNGKTYKDYLQFAMAGFQPGVVGNEKKMLLKEIKHAFFEYHIRPDEFFLYHFDYLSEIARESYLPQKAKSLILMKYYGDDWKRLVWQLQDKFTFYTIAKPFFKRDVVRIASNNDWNDFLLFCEAHPVFICKVIDKGCGLGIRKCEVHNAQQAKELFDNLLNEGTFIIEEVIKQNDIIAMFNDSSVNTVRYLSFRHGNMVVGAYPVLRTGRAGSIVDNAGQGGLFASIDINSGMICSNGFDEYGHEFECHPESGVRFKEFKIPKWNELIRVARDAHLALPKEHVYVAFDFALSDKGWVVVEGNWGDVILQQTSLKRGLKKEFVELLESGKVL